MALKLEDNTQEAFQFLMLGAGIVLVFRIAFAGAELLLAPGDVDALHRSIAHHRHGYLIADRNVLVTGAMDLTGRLAFSAVLAVAFGVIGSAISAALAKAFSRPALPAAVRGARIGLVFSIFLFTYASLFLPPNTAELREEGVLLKQRPSIAGWGLPWPAQERLVPWSQVRSVEHHKSDAGAGGVFAEVLLTTTDGESIPIGRLRPTGRDRDRAATAAVAENTVLAEEITRRFLNDR